MSGAPRPPECISLEVHRDHGHPVERWLRWALVATLTVVAVAGLANVFGERSREASVSRGGTTLRLTAPDALRSGLFFQGRFEIETERSISRPTLVLDGGWLDAVTVNTVQPEPTMTASEDGRMAFTFGRLPGGRAMTVYVELQVNPTTIGRRRQGVELRDGNRTLASIERTVVVFP